MKYLKAKFVNYIGFYNGMGLDQIEIDFTKSQHRVILITGRNGSGKSTLLNHLNPFPDGSSSFIPDKTAEKHLVLENEGDIYIIQLVSPADLKGRKTTKAYIQKNGLELNENGNVSSYKDIIFSEFELDSNYISLATLSGTDRGLGDKTPAERKKFASNIIDNLETYNSMYKTLNKKSLVYKSHINTLHTKIQNIGDKDMLDQRLTNLRIKESDLNAKILSANNSIVSIQAKNTLDEDEAKKINDATNSANSLRYEMDLLKVQLDSLYHKTKVKMEDIKTKYESDTNLANSYDGKINEISTIWKSKSERLSDVSSSIVSIQAELDSAELDDTIAGRYDESNNIISKLNKELEELGVPADISLIFEITSLINVCDKFILLIDDFNDGLSPSEITFLVEEYTNDTIPSMINMQNNILGKIELCKQQLEELQDDIKTLAILESRPSKCNIDKCPFISEAIQLKSSLDKSKRNVTEELSLSQQNILELSDGSRELQEKIDYVNLLVPKSIKLDTIRRLILENEGSFAKFYPDFLVNYESMISNMNSFNIIREHRKITDGLNLLKMLEVELQNNKILQVEYNAFRDKVKLVNSSKVMLENLTKEQESLIPEISSLKTDIDNFKSMVSSIRVNLSTYADYSTKYDKYLELDTQYKAAQSIVDDYQAKSSKAIESLNEINNLRGVIDTLSAELNPVMQEISSISGQLTLLESYYEEYNNYNQSYKIIETLKKYCSPTGGGIQTLFMQLYMSKTKELANNVLAMLFNGSYQLLDFIINDSEFRIPFIGEGLPVDDISSGSSAQVSMMSMIINLVLLHQGSSKFNIAMLDEINGSLDTYNNSIFVNVILQCMNILQIDQLFMISHSIDTDGSFADIIKLKGYDNYEFNLSGNVIFDYNDLIK